MVAGARRAPRILSRSRRSIWARRPSSRRSRRRRVASSPPSTRAALGLAVIELGGGRRRVEDRIDHSVGLTRLAGLGACASADGRAARAACTRARREDADRVAAHGARGLHDRLRNAAPGPVVDRSHREQAAMTRAFLIVLDSFGIGGAPDAAAFGDEGADTLGHIAAACAAGRGDRRACGAGRSALPNFAALGLGLAAEAATGRAPPGLDRPSRPRGLCGATRVETSSGKDTPSGHWEIAGVPVTEAWGYFPNTEPCFPEGADRRAHRQGGPARHPRQHARLRHRHHRRAG